MHAFANCQLIMDTNKSIDKNIHGRREKVVLQSINYQLSVKFSNNNKLIFKMLSC